ncbi:hypothetical protein KAR91_32535 [Candidatus Pacearchaeota archaeon]|nr:hypothetical protein [Candidatus Pacearchaeota archaeon]
MIKIHTAKREKLPECRLGLTKKCGACGFKFWVTVNFFEGDDHRPAEVFVRIAKEGSTIAGFVEAIAITVSIALQYGVPWAVLYDKYIHQIFEPRDDLNSSLVDGIAGAIDETIKEWERLHTVKKDVEIEEKPDLTEYDATS